MGSFIPATEATIGVVDRIFTRAGAADEIMRGQSTFMVEMLETASILNTATERSLIILDEIGRGTSTYDGVSIAWAVGEYIHDRLGARTLFATHYHELPELAARLDGIKSYNVQVREWKDEVVFLHKIVPGNADRSYGIQVARLAGVPKEVINRAKSVLASLERGSGLLGESSMPSCQGAPTESKGAGQPSLFGGYEPSFLQELLELKLDNMTPIEALLKLREYRQLLQQERGSER
jgi:DNA mismatch repair protein MutS